MQLTPFRVVFATIASLMCIGVAKELVDSAGEPAWILVGAGLAAVPWLFFLIFSAPSCEQKASKLSPSAKPATLDSSAANPISTPLTITQSQTSKQIQTPMSALKVGSLPNTAARQSPIKTTTRTRTEFSAAVTDPSSAREAPTSSPPQEQTTALPSSRKPSSQAARNLTKARALPHVLLDAAYYSRHRGVPGYLYAARNNSHLDGAFKLGYTTVLPIQRIEKLSEQCAQQAHDVGEFRLVHAVPVSNSYDMEQMLFHALVSRRIDVHKEFFFGSSKGLCAALEAAGAADRAASVTPLVEYLQTADLGEDRVESARPNFSEEKTGTQTSQFVAICRNRFHAADIYKLIGGARLARLVNNLNERQRECTSQLGEYDVLHVQRVLNAKLVLRDFSTRSAELRIRPAQDFYRAPFPTLLSLLVERIAAVDRPCHPVSRRSPLVDVEEDHFPICETSLPSIACTVIRGHPSASWAPWTVECLCGSRLRVTAAIGNQGEIECPNCRRTRSCRQGAEALHCFGSWSNDS